MARNKSNRPVIAIVLTAFLAALALGLLGVLLVQPVSVSGSAGLSDGREIKIVAKNGILNSGFAISSFKETTTVEAGKYVVQFVGANVVVNGKSIGNLPEGGTDFDLLIDRSTGVKVLSGDMVVASGS